MRLTTTLFSPAALELVLDSARALPTSSRCSLKYFPRALGNGHVEKPLKRSFPPPHYQP
jgi:hypothetical protein